MMRRLALVLLLLVPLAAVVAEPRGSSRRKKKHKAKVDKQAMSMLKEADKKIYRPLEHGLEDIAFEFDVLTIKGKMTCRWMYRAATKKLGQREKKTVVNYEDRKDRRKYAASLKEYFVLVTWPILMESFADQAEGMNVEWKDSRGGMTILTPVEPEDARFDRIDFVWNDAGLPREIAWTKMMMDPDEGPYKIEYTATYQWKQMDRYWVIGSMTTNKVSGSQVVAEFSYKKIKNIILPFAAKRIDPFSGTDDLDFRKLEVNEGLSDDEFSKW